MASRIALPPRQSMRVKPSCRSFMSLVKFLSRKASSLKLTMKTSSCGSNRGQGKAPKTPPPCAGPACARAVDDEPHRHWHFFELKDPDLLRSAIFQDRERALREACDPTSEFVRDGHVQSNQLFGAIR